MADSDGTLKRNWQAAGAVLGFISGVLFTFRKLIDIPLDARLILVGVFGTVMVAFLVVALTGVPSRNIGGFVCNCKNRPF